MLTNALLDCQRIGQVDQHLFVFALTAHQGQTGHFLHRPTALRRSDSIQDVSGQQQGDRVPPEMGERGRIARTNAGHASAYPWFNSLPVRLYLRIVLFAYSHGTQ